MRRATITACLLAAAVAPEILPAAKARAPLPPGGAVVAKIAIPKGPGGLAAGEGAVWATSEGASTLSRINPARNRVVARIKVVRHKPCPGFPESCVIDPATNQVVATVPLGPARACCSDHMSVTAGAGAVWAGVPFLGSVLRVDPKTNKVVARIKLSAPSCGFLAADSHAVWAAGGFAEECATVVARVDPRTNRPAGAVKGETGPIGLALGFGSLWVADLPSKSIDRVNVRTDPIVARLRVGGIPIGLAVGFGSLWIRDDTGRVLRMKPAP